MSLIDFQKVENKTVESQNDSSRVLKTPTPSPKSKLFLKRLAVPEKKTDIQNSDSDVPPSPQKSKSPVKKSPAGPEWALNLKALDVNEETNKWITEIKDDEILRIAANENMSIKKLERDKRHLDELNREILEKNSSILSKIPIEILEQFPKFDTQVFSDMREAHNKIKARILQTDRIISKLKRQEEEKNRASTSETDIEKSVHDSRMDISDNTRTEPDVEFETFDKDVKTESTPAKPKKFELKLPVMKASMTPQQQKSLQSLTGQQLPKSVNNCSPQKKSIENVVTQQKKSIQNANIQQFIKNDNNSLLRNNNTEMQREKIVNEKDITDDFINLAQKPSKKETDFPLEFFDEDDFGTNYCNIHSFKIFFLKSCIFFRRI